MLDAVGASIERLRDRPKARQVLLLISESRDRGSESELEAVVASAQSAGVTIYAIVYSAFKTALTAKSSEIGNRPVRKGRETWGKDPGSHDAPERSPIPPPTEQRVDILAGLGELARLGKTKTAEVLSRGTGGAMLSFTRGRASKTQWQASPRTYTRSMCLASSRRHRRPAITALKSGSRVPAISGSAPGLAIACLPAGLQTPSASVLPRHTRRVSGAAAAWIAISSAWSSHSGDLADLRN